MSLQAAIGFLQRSVSRHSVVDPSVWVAEGRDAGFVFTEAELETALRVEQVLIAARRDPTWRERVASSDEPSAALVQIATELGIDVDRAKLGNVLDAYRALAGELDERDLEQVAGGAGVRFVPQTSDEVIVTFVQGDTNAPFVIGSLWNSKDKPPTSR